MILLQIIISRPYQQAAGFKKKKNPNHCKKETHSFSKIVHDLWLNCTVVLCGGFLIYIYIYLLI